MLPGYHIMVQSISVPLYVILYICGRHIRCIRRAPFTTYIFRAPIYGIHDVKFFFHTLRSIYTSAVPGVDRADIYRCTPHPPRGFRPLGPYILEAVGMPTKAVRHCALRPFGIPTPSRYCIVTSTLRLVGQRCRWRHRRIVYVKAMPYNCIPLLGSPCLLSIPCL